MMAFCSHPTALAPGASAAPPLGRLGTRRIRIRGLLCYTSGVKSIAGTGVAPESPPSIFVRIRTFERGFCPIVAGVGNRHLDFFTAAAATPIADVLLSVEVRDFEEK
jgi:hypothetical protein